MPDTGNLTPATADADTLAAAPIDGEVGSFIVPSDTLFPSDSLFPSAGQGIAPATENLGTLTPAP